MALPGSGETGGRTCPAVVGGDVSGVWPAAGATDRQRAAIGDAGSARAVVADSVVDQVADLSGADRAATAGAEQPAREDAAHPEATHRVAAGTDFAGTAVGVRSVRAGVQRRKAAPGVGVADTGRVLSGLLAGVSVAAGRAAISGGHGGAASGGGSDPLAAAQGVCGQGAQRTADRAGGDRGGAVARLVFVLRAGVAGRAGMALAGPSALAARPARPGREPGLRSPSGIPPPGPLSGRKVLPMCLA